MDFQPMNPTDYDWMTNCCVCHISRSESWPLNDSGYCQSCWEHIPARFRSADGRGTENNRMARCILAAAKRLNRCFIVPSLHWIEERNTWLWREGVYVATPRGLDVLANRILR